MRSTSRVVIAGSRRGLGIRRLERPKSRVDTRRLGKIGPPDAGYVDEFRGELHREAPPSQPGSGDNLAPRTAERLVDHLARLRVVVDRTLEDSQGLLGRV